MMKDLFSTGLRRVNGRLEILDQTQLPGKEVWLDGTQPEDMVSIIQKLQVRGAPLIGVAAALSLAAFSQNAENEEGIRHWAKALNDARPTAVNLMLAMDRLVFKNQEVTSTKLLQLAEELFEEDIELCQRMAERGAELVDEGDHILTHCNTGGLATAGIGTAFGVIQKAHEQGKKIHVFVDETRPLLQGGRLTAWELEKQRIPYTLICDNMAASLMRDGRVQKVFVGADRIALNGDFANKIGTYSVAVQAHFHQVPMYPVAPYTTIDFELESGEGIPIEQRKASEVRGVAGFFGQQFQEIGWAPSEASVYNPAFDVTPGSLISGLVLDSAVYSREDLLAGALKKMRV